MFDLFRGYLTAPAVMPGASAPAAFSNGSVTSSTERSALAGPNVADVFNSIINMIGTATTIIVILLAALSRAYGKGSSVAGFGLPPSTFAFYLLTPTNVPACWP
jgi:hypothetical protein